MMLAQAEHFDVLHDDHLVVCHIEQRPVQQLVGILTVTARQIPQSAVYALGRLQEAIPAGIFADGGKNASDFVNHRNAPKTKRIEIIARWELDFASNTHEHPAA
jgi:hypothetical protein